MSINNDFHKIIFKNNNFVLIVGFIGAPSTRLGRFAPPAAPSYAPATKPVVSLP